jgi:hypothetical protein
LPEPLADVVADTADEDAAGIAVLPVVARRNRVDERHVPDG